jgi:outer membrane immunogenic protein
VPPRRIGEARVQKRGETTVRYILFSATALAGLAATTAASAQDERPPFTGPRAELLLGYDNVQAGNDDSDDAAEGLSYGGAIGYDFQLGGAVIGIEGEYTDSTGKLRGNDIDLAGDRFTLKADRDLYVGARVGYAVAPSTLLYLKGGYTNFKVKSRYENGTGGIFEDGVTLDGYRLGAGLEQRFSLLGPSGYVKVEYRYSNYTNLDLANVDADIDADRHQVMAGVGVRF